ncbi:MAG: stage III sporulation protein AD [Clostridia bacterium]|nr:stage III sporulation protein AD [Clostridia bacterium]MDH7572653.1 stage III sporulation protein AD [Clostridia bacterium]
MQVAQIVGLALIAAVLLVVVRQQRPELGLLLSVAAGAVIFLLVLEQVGRVTEVLERLASAARVDRLYLGTLLKIIGVSYLAEFGAQVCRDAGEQAVASRVEMAAKVIIVVLALPIVVAVVDTVMRLLP